MSRSNEIFIGELERAYIFHTSYNSLEERRVWIVRNKNRNVDNIKDKLPFRIERTFNDFSEVVASISKGDNIERIIFSLADVPQKDIVKVFGNFEVIFPNYEKMMKKNKQTSYSYYYLY